jgi:hypothetical protein
MPASLIIFADLASCALTDSPSSSGVLENASNPILAIRPFTLGVVDDPEQLGIEAGEISFWCRPGRKIRPRNRA